MGWVYLYDKTQELLAQVRIYGTQTVVLVLPSVSQGDLVQVSAAPYWYGDEAWVGTRVWVERAEVTLLDADVVETSESTFAPPWPPPQDRQR
jgi:hypothetical protein